MRHPGMGRALIDGSDVTADLMLKFVPSPILTNMVPSGANRTLPIEWVTPSDTRQSHPVVKILQELPVT